jgi:tetratricopeptide (TPR) repeat protein
MLRLLLLAGVASAVPALPSPLTADRVAETEHAIEVGRLDQARLMISRAIEQGAQGEAVDRLLADLAFAEDKSDEALERYKLLLGRHPTDPVIAERAAISAVKSGNVAMGKGLADHATSLPQASWRAWNARGVVADLRSDFETADSSYKRALDLAPDQPEVLTNIGWSKLTRGDWEGAIPPLEQAVQRMPNSERAVNDLELARAALASDLPKRWAGESDEDWAARLNDAGVAAQLRGEPVRAIAAFSQAIEARTSWYARAANNLSAVDRKK